MTALAIVVARILQREGATYTNHPRDAGHETKFGITLPFWHDMTGVPHTPAQLQAMTSAQAAMLYTQWLIASGLDAIADTAVLDAVADFAVLHGLFPAVKALQQAIGVPVDGVIGPMTRAALATAPPARTALRVTTAQIRRIGTRLTTDPSQAVFARGWLNRIADRLELGA